MPAWTNPDDRVLVELLRQTRVIAVVGLSPKATRPSHQVARTLQSAGYRIVPVRPGIAEVLGEKAYPDLEAVPGRVDLVDVFRAADRVGPVIDACIERGIRAVWLQQGIVNTAAAQRARAAGMTVVMDRCLSQDYRRLFGARGVAPIDDA